MRVVLAMMLVLTFSAPAWGYGTLKEWYAMITGTTDEREVAVAYITGLAEMQNAMMAAFGSDANLCEPSVIPYEARVMFAEHLERNRLLEEKPGGYTAVEFMRFYLPLFNCLPPGED